MIYGQDWGAYLTATGLLEIPFGPLHEVGLCDFFVCKGDQEAPGLSSTTNIKVARAAGVEVVGAYYWHYPTWSAQYGIDEYSKAIDREKPDFIALDMEAGYGKSSLAISENAKFLCAGMHANFPDKPMFIYTSQNYINNTTPDSNSWIGNYGRWIASWPDWGVPHSDPERLLLPEKIKACAFPTFNPYMPTAWKGKAWQLWQYGTWQIPEGYGYPYYHQYDWDAFNGTLADLKKLCGMVVEPPGPEPTETEKVAILWQNHPEFWPTG